MKLFDFEQNRFPKLLLILGAILLVSAGLCGLQSSIGFERASTILVALGVVELAVMALSAGGFLVVLVLWPISALYERFARPPKDKVQRLIEEPDETKHDDSR